ncbi:MAG: 50S ribosomal protein L15 [Mycoplasmataceae bacterium]|nr:50S ribosomal protein L15 [Mycoplasmataceae bacterium]
MKLNELKPNKGARKDKYRAARGMAQGRGKQAGKGQSGQNKRGGTRPGFEGGQNPWFRRLPKRGFNNINHIEYQVVNLSTIEKLFKDGDTVDVASLKKANLVNRNTPVKLLANGKISKKVTVKVNKASKTAIAAIEKAGGKVELV